MHYLFYLTLLFVVALLHQIAPSVSMLRYGKGPANESAEDPQDERVEESDDTSGGVSRIVPKKKKESVYIECPNDDKRAPEMFKTSYELLIKDDAKADLIFLKREANLDALEWYYRNAVDILLNSDSELRRHTEPFEQTKLEWREMSNHFANEKDLIAGKGSMIHDRRLTTLKEQTLYKYHQFLVHRILNIKEMAQFDPSKWENLLQTVGFTNSIIKWLVEVSIPEQATELATQMLEHPGLQEAHFGHLDELIRISEGFRRFLCEKDPQQFKRRLLQVIDSPILDQLEIEHPEVLKIDKMHERMRIHLYSIFVSHRSGTPKSLAAELRIAIGLMFDELNKSVMDYSDIPGMTEAVREKVRWLKRLMFQDRTNVVSIRNICLMIQFNGNLSSLIIAHFSGGTEKKLVNKKKGSKHVVKTKELATSSTGSTDSVTKLLNWSDKHVCHESGWEERTMQMQRDMLESYHKEFLAKRGVSFEGLGERVRMLKLVPGFKFGGDTNDPHVFTNNTQLSKQINNCLIGEDVETRLAGHLGVNFIVWSRLTEAQLLSVKSKTNSDSALMKKIWLESLNKLLEKFEEVFEQNAEELQKSKHNWARVQELVGDLLLYKLEHMKGRKDLLAQKKITEILKNIGLHGNEWNEEKFEEIATKTAVKNREEMLKLLKQAKPKEKSVQNLKEEHHKIEESFPNFKELLLKSFEDHPEAKLRLPTLVSDAGVKSIAMALGWKWDPEEFGLTAELVKAAEQKERKLQKAEEEKMSEKSVDEIANAIGPIGGGATTSSRAKPKQRKASKNKRAKTAATEIEITSSIPANVSPTEEETKQPLPVVSQDMAQQLTTENVNRNKTSERSVLDVSDETISTAPLETKASSQSTSSPLSGKSCSETAEKAESSNNKNETSSTKVEMSSVIKQKQASKALQEILRENDLELSSNMSKSYHMIETAVKSLKSTIHTWNREAILLFTGSYLLQLHTPGADIDCVVLLPFVESSFLNWEILYKRFFFGYKFVPKNQEDTEEILCDLESASRHCPNWSLYCVICMDKTVNFLQRKHGRDNLPMIQVQFEDVQFYISFVSLPKHISDKFIFATTTMASECPEELEKETASSMYEKEEEKTIKVLTNLQRVDEMIVEFIDNWDNIQIMDARKGMLWALSAYRANLQMRYLIKEKQFDQFQTAFLALKLWAKNHFVYGGIFGLLNAQTLTTMLLHVFLSENVSDHPVHLLLLKFFDTFSHWKWPKSVELEGGFNANFRKNYGELDWNERSEGINRGNQLQENQFLAKEHAKPVWPVIVPGFPTQNSAFNINAWTKHPILNEFSNGLAKMNSIHGKIMSEGPLESEAIKQHWIQWLDGGRFDEKYDHFMVIFCAANSVQHVRIFCDYVEGRIRMQLLFTFGDIRDVQWIHASPEKVHFGTSCPSSEKVHLSTGNVDNWLCTIWLVGVQLVDFDHIINRLENFTQKIYESFKYKERLIASSPRRLHRNISLPALADLPLGSPSNSAHSPRQLAPVEFTRQSSLPTLRQSAPVITRRQGSKLSPIVSARQGSEAQNVEAESTENEMLWAKYFNKAQLQEWLEENGLK